MDKSLDAFLFAIEIINKPTLSYRTENFVFNICIAWELVLKAQIIERFGESSIYYDAKNDRTINLQRCLDIIFTDSNNPTKRNIQIIAKIRNKATHFITPEYDDIYITFFQANVLYFVEHIKEVFSINMSERLPSNFLTIATNPQNIENIRLLSKVDKKTFNDFLKTKKGLLINRDTPGNTVSFEMRIKSVKKNEDLTFRIDNSSEISAQFIKVILDPSNSHPYRQKDIIEKINSEFGPETLNQYSFRCIKAYEKLDESDEFYYCFKQSNSKAYSEKALQLIRKKH